jgi:hypothetical protein
MRSVIVVALSAIATLTMVSFGQAQNDPPAADQPAVSSDSVPLEPDARRRTPDDPGITPAQEEAIPYRPCNANVEFADGRHSCLSDK